MATTTTTHQQTGEQRWTRACNQQGWNEASQIIHLEGFIREKGLFDELAAYAEMAAAEENGADL